MMQKIITFGVNDLALDTDEVAARLTEACSHRRAQYRVRGLCQVREVVYFVLLGLPRGDPPESYVIVPVDDLTDAGVTAMLEQRWEAGFDAVGMVNLGDDACLALFARPQEQAQ